MEFGVCGLSLIPIRGFNSHKSEMVSQLLFGETFRSLKQNREWIYIETTLDQYRGWIDGRQIIPISESNFDNINENTKYYSIDVVRTARSIHKEHPVLMGSPLPFYATKRFSFFDDKYSFEGKTVNIKKVKANGDLIKEIGLKFLSAPYLWGGRTPLGVDCSGFSQTVFRLCGIDIPRDSSEQAKTGKLVAKINDARTGDLAFFHNAIGEVSHVGIMLNNNQILHAHGKVRIDSISKDGIYNNDLQKQTHPLKFIKRYFNQPKKKVENTNTMSNS